MKTTIGGKRNFLVAAGCAVITLLLLHMPFARLTGLAFPLLLLGGAAYLARH